MEPRPLKRILVPYDFSACAEVALAQAVALARRLEARLDVLYVSEMPIALTASAAAADAWLDEAARRRDMEKLLGDLRRAGVASCDGDVVAGVPADTIVQYADSGRYDLVVMSTHGRTGFRRWWMGSVAEQVVRRARIPVLTMHPPE